MGATSPMGTREPFEPASLNDPVALTTAWTPCVRGGTNICTHTLVERGADRRAFRPTVKACVLYAFLLSISTLPFVTVIHDVIESHSVGFGHAILVFFGSLFLWFGLWVLWRGTQPIVFDRSLGMYWMGWRTPTHGAAGKRAEVLDLAQVHALQVVSEYCAGKRSSFYSYELNLVLQDGARLNIVDHGNRTQLRADAEALATFLGVPLWDPS